MSNHLSQPTPPDVSLPDESGVRDSLCETLPRGDPRSVSQAAERLGAVVAGHWRLVRVLGAGSVGAVYEARHLETGQRIAAKLLHEALRTSREQELRFLREARTASALTHPNIVRIYDTGREADGTLYQLQELLEGEDLGTQLQHGPLSATLSIHIGLQLLSALQAVHEAGFVHRDVKPENLILLPTGGSVPWVKLVDFGIAKHLWPQETAPITLDGTVVGTPHYMSPEHLRGQTLTVHSDIWAVGALLYHMLTGGPPFDEEHLHQLLTRIVSEPAPSLVTAGRNVPAHVVETVDRALRRDPSSRWSSAAEMACALAPR